MIIILAGILSIIALIGVLLLIYSLQKKGEEIRELKNIILNVHDRALSCKNAPAYAAASEEIKKTLDYVIISTASTTALNPSPNYIKEVLEINQ